jgi:hypothetical protein
LWIDHPYFDSVTVAMRQIENKISQEGGFLFYIFRILIQNFLMHAPANARMMKKLLTVHAVEEVRQYWGDNLHGDFRHQDDLAT